MESPRTNLRKYLSLSLLLLLGSCIPPGTSSSSTSLKIIVTEDTDYEDIVGMVKIYATHSGDERSNPVTSVHNREGFTLKFDLFQENFIPISARYIHCQANWEPSNLADIRYLDSYNEYTVDQFDYSANTKIPYVSYSTNLPTPTQSGNYLIVVYRGYDKRDALFSRRVVVENQVITINPNVRMSTTVLGRYSNQQIDLSIDYSQLKVSINPLRDFRVVILQNHNWESALTGLQPTLIRQDESYLEYFPFSGENNFAGGNEFRFFDLRSVDYRGMNISNVVKEDSRVIAFVTPDNNRSQTSYSQINRDLNGGYYLENTDPGDVALQSEYVWVYFDLFEDLMEGDVYVTGKFNNWRLDDLNRVYYDEKSHSYRGRLLLKQGYYNYRYYLKSVTQDPLYFDGSFYQTSNDYEIIVYLRDPTTNIDRIVGYKAVSSRF